MLLVQDFTHVAFAGDHLRDLEIQGQRFVVLERDEPPVLISASCRVSESAQSAFKCEAWTRYLGFKKTPKDLRVPNFGNPGAVACDSLKGVKVIARDAARNETLFCLFNDGSMISSGSLNAKAVLNERAAQHQ